VLAGRRAEHPQRAALVLVHPVVDAVTGRQQVGDDVRLSPRNGCSHAVSPLSNARLRTVVPRDSRLADATRPFATTGGV